MAIDNLQNYSLKNSNPENENNIDKRKTKL